MTNLDQALYTASASKSKVGRFDRLVLPSAKWVVGVDVCGLLDEGIILDTTIFTTNVIP